MYRVFAAMPNRFFKRFCGGFATVYPAPEMDEKTFLQG